MIQLSSAGKGFASKTLFEGLNWVVGPQEHVGLVGANGTGKSTLLKVLAGMETLDEGTFSATKGVTSGYLPQDGLVPLRPHRTGRMPLGFWALAGLSKEEMGAPHAQNGSRASTPPEARNTSSVSPIATIKIETEFQAQRRLFA